MKLSGEITSIIFLNELNSYTVAEMYLDRIKDKITIVGYLPFVVIGDNLNIYGNFVTHKDYGRQFKVNSFEKLMPKTTNELEKYLGSGQITGIGKARAKKIVNKFGDETVEVLKNQPLKLAEIKGITKEKALEISASFVENWEVWQIVGFLGKLGIGAENAKRIYENLGANAVKQIEDNPYILIDYAKRIDFKQIDRTALKLGVSPENDTRVQSGIKYALFQITYNGNCCTLKQNLIEYTKNLLDVSEPIIENNLINLKVAGDIVEEKRDDESIWIYLSVYYHTEANIAKQILFLNKGKTKFKIKDIETKLENRSDIKLSEKQKQAITAVNDNNVTIITGGPRYW